MTLHATAGLLLLAALLVSGPAFAEKPFDGEDAAYIDWSWRNCGTVSTAKEHGLADAANAKGGERFHTDYMEHLRKIDDVKRTPAQVRHLCSQIQDKYGPEFMVMPGMIKAKGGERPY